MVDPPTIGRRSLQKQSSSYENCGSEKAFKLRVWIRDRGCDRATGLMLSKDGDWEHRGEVCHLQAKGAYPERKWDPSNAILLSHANHVRSDHRGGRLLRMTDPMTGEPAIDATQEIQFTLYDRTGQVVWSRIR